MKKLNNAERIIFPLDYPNWLTAKTMVQNLAGHITWFKIGLELFIAEGPPVIEKLKNLAPEAKVFLDLKLHDIPATVGGAMRSVSKLGVDLITVHSQGGLEMLEQAVEYCGDSKVLAVTMLTSLNPNALDEFDPQLRENPNKLVQLLAKRAIKAGCHGLVASGEELKTLRAELGAEPYLVIPGIRPKWSMIVSDDQKRITTPKRAIKEGADFLVIGRPIRDSKDPCRAVEKIIEELES